MRIFDYFKLIEVRADSKFGVVLEDHYQNIQHVGCYLHESARGCLPLEPTSVGGVCQ